MNTSIQSFWINTTSWVGGVAHSVADRTQQMYHRAEASLHNHKPFLTKASEKIQTIVPPILFALAAGMLFFAQSSIFGLGFLASIITPSSMQKAIDKISTMWCQQHPIVKGMIAAAATVAWPISLAASAFFVGGKIGLLLVEPEPAHPAVCQSAS